MSRGGVLRWGNAQSVQIDLSGEHGSARLERERLRVWLRNGTMIDVSEDTSLPAVAKDYLAHRRLIEDMLDALDTARSPAAEGRASLVVHRLVEALLRSGSSGKLERV
jgi:UDP-N-acetyl-2-amino-2-deoxyglucuronate dehydrogenase